MTISRTLYRSVGRSLTRQIVANFYASASAAAISAAATLAAGESEAFAIDFTDDFYQATTGFYGSAYTLDTGTPANDYGSSPDETASSLLSFTAPSLKMCRQVDGYLAFQAHNLCLQSEAINTTWTTFNATATATVVTATDTNAFVTQTVTAVQNGTYRIDVVSEPGTVNFLRLQTLTAVTGNPSSYFNVSTGAVTAEGSGHAASIAGNGDGTYTCTITFTADAGTSLIIRTGPSSDGSTTAASAGNSITATKIHVRRTPSVDTYMATTSAARTALPLEWGVTGASDPLGLLVEEARTNLCTDSQDASTGWTTNELLAFGAGSTLNATTAPDGTSTADLITPTTNNTAHWISLNATVTISVTYSASIYVKANGYNYVQLTPSTGFASTNYCNFNLSTGAVGNQTGSTGAIEDCGDGWYRISIAEPCTSSIAGRFILTVMDTDAASRLPAFAGNGTSGVYIWQRQVEAGAFVTSPIPTLGSTVTRAADNISKAASGFSTAAEQTFYAEFGPLKQVTASGRVLGLNGGAATPIFVNSATSIGWYDSTLFPSITVADVRTDPTMAALADDVSSTGFVGNGGTVLTTAAAFSAITSLNFGSRNGTSDFLNGHIRQVMYLPRRMSDVDLQTLTT